MKTVKESVSRSKLWIAMSGLIAIGAAVSWTHNPATPPAADADAPIATALTNPVSAAVVPAVALPPAHAAPQPEAVAASATAKADAPPAPDRPGATPAAPRWTTLQVGVGDTLSTLFAANDLPGSDWRTILALGGAAAELANLHPGEHIQIARDAGGALVELRYPLDPTHSLHVARSGDGFTSSVVALPVQAHPVRVAGRIHQTLYLAARHTGLSERLTMQLIHIFAWRVDFRHGVHPGDRFSVVYDQRYRNDKRVGDSDIIAAELDLDDATLRAFRYVDATGRASYYTPNGQSLKQTLLRTPVDYTRVSSNFSLRRLNPVLHIYRPHYGVDLAAPAGTPIHAAGNGRITFRGHDGGYGNLIIIKNKGPYSTRYGHMLRFARGLKVGSYVHQGQVIGYVGSTGVATGPHLHFEIRVDGKPRNPLTVSLPNGSPVPKDELSAYEDRITPLMAALDPTPRRQANVQFAAATPQDRAAPVYLHPAGTLHPGTQCTLQHRDLVVTLMDEQDAGAADGYDAPPIAVGQ